MASTTTYTWVVEKFSTKDATESSNFSWQDEEQIQFSLEMKAKGSAGWFNNTHLMIHLRLGKDAQLGDRKQVFINYRLSIVDAYGIKCNKQDCSFMHDSTKSGLNKIRHEVQFNISRSNLLENAERFLPNDTLTILCEVLSIHSEPNIGIETKLSQDFESLLENDNFSDVTLVVSGKRFRVHKIILAARSPVFGAMFQHKLKECIENKVNIIDIGQEVFEVLLRYIYTGKVTSLAQYAEDLLIAADKYQLEELKCTCEQFLADKLTIDSVARTLLFADMNQAVELKQCCIKYINVHKSEVMLTEGWKVLIKTRLELVLELYENIDVTKKVDPLATK